MDTRDWDPPHPHELEAVLAMTLIEDDPDRLIAALVHQTRLESSL